MIFADIPQHTPPAKALRERKAGVKYVVIHTAEGSFNGTINWFTMDQDADRARRGQPTVGYQTCTHLLVGQKGDAAQFADTTKRLIHCGSSIKTGPDWNGLAVGIEHEGFADKGGFSEALLRRSAKITAGLRREHHIPHSRQFILGHGEIPGVTHHDPGPFWPWDDYMRMVEEEFCLLGGHKMRPPPPLVR